MGKKLTGFNRPTPTQLKNMAAQLVALQQIEALTSAAFPDGVRPYSASPRSTKKTKRPRKVYSHGLDCPCRKCEDKWLERDVTPRKKRKLTSEEMRLRKATDKYVTVKRY